MIPCDDDSGRDINVTLDELIDKVRGYQCMVATRRKMHLWAKLNRNLLGLCRGDYDTFCDGNDIVGQTTLDTCSISEEEEELDFGQRSQKKVGVKIKIKTTRDSGAHAGVLEIDRPDGFVKHDEGIFNWIGNEFDYKALIFIIIVVCNIIGGCLICYWWEKVRERRLKYDDVSIGGV